MAGVKHPFVNPQADDADTTKTRPSDWNAEHRGIHWFIKTADQVNSSNTSFFDVTDLVFAIAANETVVFTAYILATAAAATTGLVLAVNGPATPTLVNYAGVTTPTVTTVQGAGATAYETALVFTGVHTVTPTPTLYLLSGVVVNGATAGTVALRMRSEVSGSNATIKRGSYLQIMRA